MGYIEDIEKIEAPTIDDIIRVSRENLPKECKDKPWNFTNRGVGVYQTEKELLCYMAAYGIMHKKKLEFAFYNEEVVGNQNFLLDLSYESFEVVDWGCGQGIASMYLWEKLNDQIRNAKDNLKRFTLIDPSTLALDRAEFNIKAATKGYDIEIVKINKYLPSTVADESANIETLKDVNMNKRIIIHLFSNILDLQIIDLRALSAIVAKPNHHHAILCVGPINAGVGRINAFYRYFNSISIYNYCNYQNSWLGKHANGKIYGGLAYRWITNSEGKVTALNQYSYFPPKQFFAAYKLDVTSDDILTNYNNILNLEAFEVLAPFDLGASVCDDIHPIIAVLNNIITRGHFTKASPYIEQKISSIYAVTELDECREVIKYNAKEDLISDDYTEILIKTPIAVARLQKVIIEAILTERLDISLEYWDLLVKENDVPCAALAITDLTNMFENLTAISQEFETFSLPKINLEIISNEEHKDSKLHLEYDVFESPSNFLRAKEYDMVIDIAINSYCEASTVDFVEFKAKNDCYFNVRSSQEVYSERSIYTTDRITYKPFTKKNEQGLYDVINKNVEHLRYFLQLLFRKTDFREGQLPILTQALQNKSVIGLLPTGGGKSLTYQLSAMLQPGVTLVIDPIVSLMTDQCDGLNKVGIDVCTYINAKIEKTEKLKRELMIQKSQLIFAFISPERLCSYRFRQTLRSMLNSNIYFSYGVIDEVHCVSEWGHDFRYSYLHLGRNLYKYVLPKQKNGDERLTLFGLTATASFDVLSDVERELSGNSAFPLDSNSVVRYENTNRLELQYLIINMTNSASQNQWDVFRNKNTYTPMIMQNELQNCLMQLQSAESIKTIKSSFLKREDIEEKSEYGQQILNTDLDVELTPDWHSNNSNDAAAIVFCPHTKGLMGIKNSANNSGMLDSIRRCLPQAKVSSFMGGSDQTEQDRFISGETNIMVATKAFGMGIDKPNVRFTINVNHSGSLEAFVQEAGRAGRDRKMALAVILYSENTFYDAKTNTLMGVDFGVHKFFHDGNYLGEQFEKTVMYYLMSSHNTSIEHNNDNEYVQSESISGFINMLDNMDEDRNFTAYISYRYPSASSKGLDKELVANGLNKIGDNHKTIEDKAKRYEDALSKAIYRMCCIGVISDYTQDYVNRTFRIVATKKKAGDYYSALGVFLERYYTTAVSKSMIEEAKKFQGDNEIQKCLGYLTSFIYSKIAIKREQAIFDIDNLCKRAIHTNASWLDVNEFIKDDLYYYFNSKYARDQYQIPTGENFSLRSDINTLGDDVSKYYDLTFKYIRVVDDDLLEGGGSPTNNIKHLQGAIKLIRRSLIEVNPILSMLNAFCLLYLRPKPNSILYDELETSFIEGYNKFYEMTANKALFYDCMSKFKFEIHEKRNVTTNDQILALENWELRIELNRHTEWLKNFNQELNKK